MIVADLAQAQIFDMQRAEGLEMLRVRSLHMQLQGISQCIVLVEECLADIWYPLVGIGIEITVHGLACPQGNVIQVDDIVVSTTIDQSAKFSITDGQ